MRWLPHSYQKKAINLCVKQACAGLLLDPGLGKTAIMLATFSLLKKLKMVNTMLVIAPLRAALSTWPAEAKKWEDFAHLKVVVLHGPDKKKLLYSGADVFVINPEGLEWLFKELHFAFDILCVDESTRFKHTNTQRFKILRPHLPDFRRRYILTGSPAPNGLLDLFGQAYLLDLGNALGRFITHYRNSYFDATGYGGYTFVPRADAEEKIYRKLGPLVLRMAAEDYLELPPLVGVDPPNITEVILPKSARLAYDRMENLLIAEIKNETINAANAAAAFGKCRQIANGGIYGLFDDNDRARHRIHDEKLDATEELIEEMSGVPCLIAYEFDHERERLQERFKGAPYIGGGVSAKRFREIEEEWNKGNLETLLAQPQSVSHGLNLQATRANVLWFAPTPNLEDYEQFIRRVWRQGQKFPVFVHHIVAKGTVDEVIMGMLKRKDRTQKAFLNAMKERYA